MQFLISVIATLIGLSWTAFIGLISIPGFLLHPPLGHALHRLWARGAFVILGYRLRIEGLENLPPKGTGLILAPNHESFLDILVIYCLPVDFKWVAKAELRKVPIVGWNIALMGTYFMERNRSTKDLSTMKEAETGLQKGIPITLFPEGTRSRDGVLLPFKKGAFRTAQNAGVPLIPIGIHGTRELASPKSYIPKRGGDIRVRIGMPFKIGLEEPLDAAMERFRKELVKLAT